LAEKKFMGFQPVRLEDFFKLEYRSGSVRSLLTGERMQLVPTAFWDKLNVTLLRELQENGPPAIHLIGHSFGSALVEELKTGINDPESLMNHLSDYAAAAGWGVMSMAGDLRKGDSYTVSVMNCSFCEKGELGPQPQCSFLASAIEGIADAIYGTSHRAWEVRCAAMGEALCRFNVVVCSQSSKSLPDPGSLAYPDWESLWASPIPALLLSVSDRVKESVPA
jgi:predicted hydrocarbon binding protein